MMPPPRPRHSIRRNIAFAVLLAAVALAAYLGMMLRWHGGK